MIDTHAHINSPDYSADILEVLDRAFGAGIEYIIIPAIEPGEYSSLEETAALDSRIFISAGIHPHNAKEAGAEGLDKVRALARSPKCVAIGEIGLDYYYDFATPDEQKDAFASQVDISASTGLPMIIHNRDSDKDLIDILSEKQGGSLNGVMHCFSSGIDLLRQTLDLGFYLSFTGNITFKKSNLADVIKFAPLDRIMLETDSPYMTPPPNRGKRNEPANVRLVAEKIAEIKSISIDEVIHMTTKNAKSFFRLPMLCCLLIISLFSLANAQTNEESEDEAKQEYINPYKKSFGVGVTAGTNTIVDTYYPDEQNVSSEGIFAIGGSLYYSPIDFLTFDMTYLYSQNSKNVDKFKKDYNTDIDPNIHQVIEFSAHISPNPSNRVNFFMTGGCTYFMNKYASNIDGKKVYTDDDKFGLNTGLGFYANIPAGSAGLFVMTAEWRLNFMLGKTHLRVDPRNDPRIPSSQKPVDVSTFFSIPRFGIIWYPKF